MVRIAIIDKDKCQHEKCGYACKQACPGVRMGDETVTIGEDGYPIISELLCTGCGICVKRCPVQCIKIINLKEERGKPIYQYGINSFRLYGLPLPRAGVTGLVGKNGIGKSTALKILAGQIQPNHGDYSKKWTHDDILNDMNIIEQAYFTKLNNNEINISIKPQHVDLIRDVFDGKVKDLLIKTDEKNMLNKIIDDFELSQILERDIKQLSGGELQRVAIAAAYLKKAELYYFDEPLSYLDIEQRIKITKRIKSLAKDSDVIVIEHDLALLDYLSDQIYIFYGTENAYGVTSSIKPVRNGINEYLDGYLKDDNIRFRENAITFQSKAEENKRGNIYFSYIEMTKEFDGFTFSSEKGEVYEGEIIGILGRNAIGKSLFIKMLAGVEQPTTGDQGLSLKVAYKPQYIKTEENVIVEQLFRSKQLDDFTFKECVKKLNISQLMMRELTELSGGELQRVAIVLTLSQEADVYLFDEPSAFLDTEQRLHFANLLRDVISRNKKSCFVVDHDIIMMDLIANRLMIFEGEGSVKGHANAPVNKKKGMNRFLKNMNITMRRDKDSHRPRINKTDSAKDKEMKSKGQYYYSD